MPITPTPAESDDPASPATWERTLLDRQLERLDQLADMGMALAADIQRRAAAAAPDADISHAAIDFARTSRAVRMTLALQSKLVRDFKTPIKAGAAASDDDDDEPIEWKVVWKADPPTRDQQRANVRRAVRGVAEDDGLDAETVERLDGEARERLERDDIYADIVARPVSEIVADICRDLGLSPDWGRLAETQWAKDEIEDSKIGWPLAAVRAARRSPSPLDGERVLDRGLAPPFHGSS
jgi:hypothetical protein